MYAFVALAAILTEPSAAPAAKVTTPEPSPVKVDFAPTTAAQVQQTQAQPQAQAQPKEAAQKPIYDEKIIAPLLQKDLEDLSKLFEGIWDSDNQAFFEPELGIPTKDRHPRLYAKVTPFINKAIGEHNYYVEYRKGGETGELLRSRIFTLTKDLVNNGISQNSYEVTGNIKLNELAKKEKGFDAIKPSDLVKLNGCEIIFKRRVSGFAGDTIANSCKLKTKDGKIIISNEHHDIDAKFWEVTDIAHDEKGQFIYGNKGTTPTKLRKANEYICWASYAIGNNTKFANDLLIHDSGGEVKADFGTNSIKLRLRNVEWPTGNNRPSLTLYLLQNNQDFAQIYAWTDENAPRIALASNAYQASCTKK